MPEILTLDSPETAPSITTWKIKTIYIDVDVPYIKVDFKSNTGKIDTWRLTPNETTPASEITAGLLFIDSGKFKTVQGKSLRKWLMEQAIAKGFKVGTITGTPE